jgi:hypothetical protein
VVQYTYRTDDVFELDSNQTPFERNDAVVYEIMHMDKVVASISTYGDAEILNAQFMPYDLFFEEEKDFDARTKNLNGFLHWCASRILTLDRKYAKEILNSIGAPQSITDRERAEISMSFHCVSLTDVYWTRERGETISFADLNLYDNPLEEAIVEVSLQGRNLTVTNKELTVQDFAPDLSTRGCFPKAWIRTDRGVLLLKDGGAEIVRKEVLASQICQCFDIPQVVYWEHIFDDEPVSACELVTSKEYAMISKKAFEIFTINNGLDVIEECIALDPVTYYGMNILDYLIGNTDRHMENWGLLIDNATNKPLSLYPLMDFNQCFFAYTNLDGANCLTVNGKMTQREAAVNAVKHIGLRQVRDIDMSQFAGMEREAEMFVQRLDELRKYV